MKVRVIAEQVNRVEFYVTRPGRFTTDSNDALHAEAMGRLVTDKLPEGTVVLHEPWKVIGWEPESPETGGGET